MGKRQALRLVLDDGGPMVIWTEKASRGLPRKLLVTTRICDNPECDCRDVWVNGIVVDDRYKNIESRNHRLSYSFRPGEGRLSEPLPLRQLSAAVNIDSGEATFTTNAPPERHDEEMLRWLREGLGEQQLEALRKRWRLAKGVDQDLWRRKDWSWWQPGDMISWLEVFPDDINIVFALDGDCYWVDDLYCINPGCTCEESGLCFARVTKGKVEDIGAISVILPAGRFSKFMREPANARVLKRLWGHVRKRPGVLALLEERRRRIKPIGQEIVRLTGGGKGVVAVPLQKKPGRNDPCPCGSGKKFKRCCEK